MNIHFVGIGGIGTSSLARHFLALGESVTGSDLTINNNVRDLMDRGAIVYNGHSDDNVSKDIDLVVHSPAVQKENPELQEAERLSIEVKSYPEALGKLTNDYFTIAISGTHGKSTTTAMAALALIEAGIDPTVIIGTKVEQFGNSNYRKGNSKYLLIEADEWNGSMLNYNPNVIVLTNLEMEHLDYYKDLNHLENTFLEYLNNLPKDGVLIKNEDHSGLKNINTDKKTYLFSKKNDISDEIKKILKVPGNHNLENALAAYKLGEVLGGSKEDLLKGLSNFSGTWRRFQEKEITIAGNNHKVIVDYAHHPTELGAILEALREKFKDEKVVAVFQPHQYQRSHYLFDEFIKELQSVPIDKLFLTDIYSVPGREDEEIKKKVSSKKIVLEANNKKVDYLPGDLKQAAKLFKERLQSDEIVAIIGAGDIYLLEKFLKDK